LAISVRTSKTTSLQRIADHHAAHIAQAARQCRQGDTGNAVGHIDIGPPHQFALLLLDPEAQ
jgi:hypothetical protein